jgi:hypothetical protein
MEYLIAIFQDPDGSPIDRGVIITGQSAGRTNVTLMVGRGHQEVSLEGPPDFTPATPQQVNVKHTTSEHPLEVNFVQNQAGV